MTDSTAVAECLPKLRLGKLTCGGKSKWQNVNYGRKTSCRVMERKFLHLQLSLTLRFSDVLESDVLQGELGSNLEEYWSGTIIIVCLSCGLQQAISLSSSSKTVPNRSKT
eukprot:1172473-Amphidinium_carterae.1